MLVIIFERKVLFYLDLITKKDAYSYKSDIVKNISLVGAFFNKNSSIAQ